MDRRKQGFINYPNEFPIGDKVQTPSKISWTNDAKRKPVASLVSD